MTTATRNERIAQFKQAIENFKDVLAETEVAHWTEGRRAALRAVIDHNARGLAAAEAEPEDSRDLLAAHREHIAQCRRCQVATEAAPYFGDNPAADGCSEGESLLRRLMAASVVRR